MIQNPQKVNSNIFGNRELSKQEHERIKNEKINPLDRYIISIPEFVYQGINFVQSTEEEFLIFKEKSIIKAKLIRDKRTLKYNLVYVQEQYLNKKMDLQKALFFIENENNKFFTKKMHLSFYRSYAHFKPYIEQYFNTYTYQ